MKKIEDKYENNTFENIKHIDEDDNEYWFARQLQKVVSSVGVKNMTEFHNAGCKRLYNGEIADDIFKRKKLHYREDILNNMNEDELVANLFRINQTKQKLLRDNV